jgi:hypothetical protein
MRTEQFDDIARALANGVSRRQILKAFAAGAGASLFSAIGLGGRGAHVASATGAAEDSSIFMPLITSVTASNSPDICSVASTCEKKHYCDKAKDCRCIMSAEGTLRCGKVPSCDIKRCTTSADCAELGEGYFCDTPHSGCCNDGHLQRCVAPCEGSSTCPPARTCGTTCCEEGDACIGGVCANALAGTWTGTVTYESQSIGIRFILQAEEQMVTGEMLMQDPETKKFLETGAVSGERFENFAYWTTEAKSFIQGDLNGNFFTGAFTFAPFNDEYGFEAQLSLQRGST